VRTRRGKQHQNDKSRAHQTELASERQETRSMESLQILGHLLPQLTSTLLVTEITYVGNLFFAPFLCQVARL
jgi:hypothetical protein